MQAKGVWIELGVFRGQFKCSKQTSSEGPVLEEFIPIKRASSSEEDEHNHKSRKSKTVSNDSKSSEKLSTKSDWLRSVQLWNQTPDPSIKEVLNLAVE